MARKLKPTGALMIYVVKVAYTIPSEGTRTLTRTWPVVARHPQRATERAIKELGRREREKATVVRTDIREHGPADPSHDVTLEIAGKSFTYKQPGATPSMLREEE